ncbi:hypothetical protein HID58_060873 [Brassica napus]|uniref:YTH domain-containing family protein n=2 Tax=Brassica napus TaxID=3708 RepID=A0ABQ7ZX19_BRANA|nr:hypothetical protein HID58_060873 [Brassica napus]CDY50448.1 BnaC04g24940D [Brassica napus]
MSLQCDVLISEADVYGGNSNNGFSTKKKLGYNNNNGYYGGYYPQAYQYYPRYGYDMMNYASGKTTNTTLQYSYLGRSDKRFFSNTYTNAKLFVIKSYSEDDIHKSIKYNVWSSTSNGNKKLNTAYNNEHYKKNSSCPIFLIFSVNTSGQFVGLAEMMAECWQQDKWVGCFPVKCHIVKDIPNSSLRHITLENNENKPVTNSRDTQEVKIEQEVEQSFTASDKKATPKDKSKETSVIAEVAEEISQNGVAEVASTC